MIYVRWFITLFTFSLVTLYSWESGWVSWMFNFLTYLALVLILGFSSWYFSRWASTLLLRPFVRINPKNQAVLVTGCDTILGQLTAISLNRLGFFVFASLSGSNFSDTSKKMIKDSPFPARIRVMEMDVRNSRQVARCLETVTPILKESSCSLYALINCLESLSFGHVEFGPEGSLGDYTESMEVNLFGVIRVTKTFLPLIRESRGRIVNVSGFLARLSTPVSTAYSVSKAALSKFTEGLQIEMAQFGVSVIGIEPWMQVTNVTTTKSLMDQVQSNWESTPNGVKKSYGKKYFYQVLKFADVFSRFPLYVEPEKVVTCIEDNLLSPEPQQVARVINPLLGFWIWIFNDILSWELGVFIRTWIYWYLFKLLSIEYYFGVRSSGSRTTRS